jgi:hypothetical protein
MLLINNKIKQAHAGNWGKPNGVEQKVDLPEDIYLSKPLGKGKKKKREGKKVWDYFSCPFCGKELKKLPVDNDLVNIWAWGRESNCECGCYEVENCPSCKRKTWYNPITKIFKHSKRNLGCGFEGAGR